MPNDDYVKRSDALYAIAKWEREHKSESDLIMAISTIMECIVYELPAADVEPRRESGVWIEQPDRPNVESNRIYRCSVCGYADEQSPTAEVPYCWHCGSRMRKMQKEEDNGSVQ